MDSPSYLISERSEKTAASSGTAFEQDLSGKQTKPSFSGGYKRLASDVFSILCMTNNNILIDVNWGREIVP